MTLWPARHVSTHAALQSRASASCSFLVHVVMGQPATATRVLPSLLMLCCVLLPGQPWPWLQLLVLASGWLLASWPWPCSWRSHSHCHRCPLAPPLHHHPRHPLSTGQPNTQLQCAPLAHDRMCSLQAQWQGVLLCEQRCLAGSVSGELWLWDMYERLHSQQPPLHFVLSAMWK